MSSGENGELVHPQTPVNDPTNLNWSTPTPHSLKIGAPNVSTITKTLIGSPRIPTVSLHDANMGLLNIPKSRVITTLMPSEIEAGYDSDGY